MSALDLCKPREKRFLNDLLEAAAPDRHDHLVPELYAIMRAAERMLGGHFEKPPLLSTKYSYYLVLYEAHAPHTPEEVEERREDIDLKVRRILQGFMESVALAIKDGSSVTHKDGAASIDLFRIPPWFYEEVMRDVQLTDAASFSPSPANGARPVRRSGHVR